MHVYELNLKFPIIITDRNENNSQNDDDDGDNIPREKKALKCLFLISAQ